MDGITYTSGTGAIAVDSTVVRTTGAQVLQVKKHSNNVVLVQI